MADLESGKVFVGGISWETTAATLTDYFSRYGEVSYSTVAKDRESGNPRGFGFVTFSDPSSALKALEDHHEIYGRTVEVKIAKPKQVQHHYPSNGESSGSRTKKIFVGGLSSNVTEEEFKSYFTKFGTVTDVVVMYDNVTSRSRGFGFVTFDSEEVVEKITSNNFHVLGGKYVEVKKAIPKEVSRNIGQSSSSSGGVAFPYPHDSYLKYYPSYGGVSPMNYDGVYGAGYHMAGPEYSYLGYGYGFPLVAPSNQWNGLGMVGFGQLSHAPSSVYPMNLASGAGSFGVSYGVDNVAGFRKPDLGGGSNYAVQRIQMLNSTERKR